MRTTEIYADSRTAAVCRGCQAPMVFAEIVATGKRMPFDPPLAPLGIKGDAPRVIHVVDLGQSHFATCPQSARFSRKARR